MITCGDHGGMSKQSGEPCGQPEGWGTDFDSGRCKFHRGTNADGSSHTGNKNAVKHGAYAKSFVTDFLTDDEIDRVKEAQDLLGTPEGAKGHARLIASICVEQFRRSGDERFLRRYESICDKFGIAPAEEIKLNAEHRMVSVELTEEVVETPYSEE